MSKVKINYILKSDRIRTVETEGILNKNHLVFKDDDIMFNIDLDNLILNRENEEYNLTLDFKNNKGSLKVKKLGLVDIKLITKKIDNLNIKYILNDEEFELKINYEVIE